MARRGTKSQKRSGPKGILKPHHGEPSSDRAFKAKRLSERSFAARERSIRALRDMRHGASPTQAARDNGVTLRTIKKYAGATLFQDRPGGRIRVSKSDRLTRYLQIPGLQGPIEIPVRALKQASETAKFDSAVNRYLNGHLDALAPWHGKKIGGVELITDGPTLKGLAQKDLLPHSLYRSLSSGAA